MSARGEGGMPSPRMRYDIREARRSYVSSAHRVRQVVRMSRVAARRRRNVHVRAPREGQDSACSMENVAGFSGAGGMLFAVQARVASSSRCRRATLRPPARLY